MSTVVTRWQVRVGEEWQVVEPDIAAAVAFSEEFGRPNDVRLADVAVPAGLWFTRGQRAEARPVTKNRLVAAERALLRQREAVPLFAGQLAAEQPSPAERVEACNIGSVAWWGQWRWDRAMAWRRARAALAALSPEKQIEVRERWARRVHGGHPSDLLHVIRRAGGGGA